MNYTNDAPRHTWSRSSSRFVASCVIAMMIGALMALGSVELVRVTCERASDRCEVVNVTLLGGRQVRDFAPSRVSRFDLGLERKNWSSRGMRQTAVSMDPRVELEDGEAFSFRVSQSTSKLQTTMWSDLDAFFQRSEGDRVSRREVFSGWGLAMGCVLLAMVSLAGVLGGRSTRMVIDTQNHHVRLRRRGVFSPVRHEGSTAELEACVVQPDASTSSPGIFLRTREGAWLTIDLHTSFVNTEAFAALERVLAEVGVPVVQADRERWPVIDYSRFPIALGLIVLLVVGASVGSIISGLLLLS